MGDASIVRNRVKIEATIANARAALDVDLSELIWSLRAGAAAAADGRAASCRRSPPSPRRCRRR